MTLRTRFFDDWRLSRIDEESTDRLSVNSETSAVDPLAAGDLAAQQLLAAQQRSASADGTLQTTGNDDDDDGVIISGGVSMTTTLPSSPPPPAPEMQPRQPTSPPPPLPVKVGGIVNASTPTDLLAVNLDALNELGQVDEALRFMQVKYDTLGRVRVEKRRVTDAAADASSKIIVGPVAETTHAKCDCYSDLMHDNNWTQQQQQFSTAPAGMNRNAMFPATGGCAAGSGRRGNETAGVGGVTVSCRQLSADQRVARPTTTPAEIDGYSNRAPVGPQHFKIDPAENSRMGLPAQHATLTRQPQSTTSGGRGEAAARQPQTQIRGGNNSAAAQAQQQNASAVGLVTSRNNDQPQKQQQQHQQQRSAGGGSRKPLPLTNAELFQVDLFYRSRKTLVHVCPCAATLYFSACCPSRDPSTPDRVASDSWQPTSAGVPVAVLDTTANRRQSGRLFVVLAERGTGFELWRHALDNVDRYTTLEERATTTAFHTVLLPPADRDEKFRLAGLRFDDALAAAEFRRQVGRFAALTEADLNALQSGKNARSKAGGGTAKRKSSGKGGKVTSFSKADISQPCCFTHVTRLERNSTLAPPTTQHDSTSRNSTAAGDSSAQQQRFAAVRSGHSGPFKLPPSTSS